MVVCAPKSDSILDSQFPFSFTICRDDLDTSSAARRQWQSTFLESPIPLARFNLQKRMQHVEKRRISLSHAHATSVSLQTSCVHVHTAPRASIAQFEAVVTAALGGNNDARKAAEQALDAFKQQSPDTYIASLAHLLGAAQDASARVLSGVLLRQQLDTRGQYGNQEF